METLPSKIYLERSNQAQTALSLYPAPSASATPLRLLRNIAKSRCGNRRCTNACPATTYLMVPCAAQVGNHLILLSQTLGPMQTTKRGQKKCFLELVLHFLKVQQAFTWTKTIFNLPFLNPQKRIRMQTRKRNKRKRLNWKAQRRPKQNVVQLTSFRKIMNRPTKLWRPLRFRGQIWLTARQKSIWNKLLNFKSNKRSKISRTNFGLSGT